MDAYGSSERKGANKTGLIEARVSRGGGRRGDGARENMTGGLIWNMWGAEKNRGGGVDQHMVEGRKKHIPSERRFRTQSTLKLCRLCSHRARFFFARVPSSSSSVIDRVLFRLAAINDTTREL